MHVTAYKVMSPEHGRELSQIPYKKTTYHVLVISILFVLFHCWFHKKIYLETLNILVMLVMFLCNVISKSVIFYNSEMRKHIGYPAPSDNLSLVKMSKDYDEGQGDFIIEKSHIPEKYYLRYNDNPQYVLGVVTSGSKNVGLDKHLTRLGFHPGYQNILFEVKRIGPCLNIIFEGECATWDPENSNITFKPCKGGDRECFFFTTLGR